MLISVKSVYETDWRVPVRPLQSHSDALHQPGEIQQVQNHQRPLQQCPGKCTSNNYFYVRELL